MKLFAAALFAVGLALGQTGVNLNKALPAAPAPFIPVMHVDTLALTTVAQGATNVRFPLSVVPVASMGAIIQFTSSQLGGDVTVFAPIINPSIVFTLPTYSPFTSADVVSVAYWSTK